MIENIETYLKSLNEKQLKSKTSCVVLSGWKPEVDMTGLLLEDNAAFYQSQIGVLQWAVELAGLMWPPKY
jgi:hypothetical protein